jgi:hypothetical protein
MLRLRHRPPAAAAAAACLRRCGSLPKRGTLTQTNGWVELGQSVPQLVRVNPGGGACWAPLLPLPLLAAAASLLLAATALLALLPDASAHWVSPPPLPPPPDPAGHQQGCWGHVGYAHK